MSKVFIVTKGQYSDYSIHAVYSCPAEAARIAEIVRGRVEDYYLDEPDKYPKGKLFFRVDMEMNGDSASVRRDEPLDMGSQPISEDQYVEYEYQGGFSVSCWAKDDQHAIKICNEKRIAYLASKPERQ
jgi:hypothetical protein